MDRIGWLWENEHVDYNFDGVVDADEPRGMPVMGILHHDHSRIFLMGDSKTGGLCSGRDQQKMLPYLGIGVPEVF